MITDNKDERIALGLTVDFDGITNTLLCDGIVKEYPIGGLLCEYFRLHPTEIKDVILSCALLDSQNVQDDIVGVIFEFHDKLHEKFKPVIAIMVSCEFMTFVHDMFLAERDNSLNEFFKELDDANLDSIKDYIFEDTPHNSFGNTDILQVMLSAYMNFASRYINYKYLFMKLNDTAESEDDSVYDIVARLYSDLCGVQNIDFCMVSSVEKGLLSLYTIKSTASLFTFEIAHFIKAEKHNFVKCANCDNYFVPEGRSDTKYCSYTAPQNPNKKCSDIGAQIARANKEKQDETTREYRKLYMRYKMITRRHPHDKIAKEKFHQLTTEVKQWRKDLNQGTVTVTEFLEWLNQFNNQNYT